MKTTHASAAACDHWVRVQIQEAVDDSRPSIDHTDVMKKARANRGDAKGPAYEGLNGDCSLMDILDYIGRDNPDAAVELVQKIHKKAEGPRETDPVPRRPRTWHT